MLTVSVLIGNSDDKLSQVKWAYFAGEVDQAVHLYGSKVHFSGGSDAFSIYQCACLVAEITEDNLDRLKDRLAEIKDQYGQESIAVVTGQTEFI